jgi:hypothetical protein
MVGVKASLKAAKKVAWWVAWRAEWMVALMVDLTAADWAALLVERMAGKKVVCSAVD